MSPSGRVKAWGQHEGRLLGAGLGTLTWSPTQYFPAVLCRIRSRAVGRRHEQSYSGHREDTSLLGLVSTVIKWVAV